MNVYDPGGTVLLSIQDFVVPGLPVSEYGTSGPVVDVRVLAEAAIVSPVAGRAGASEPIKAAIEMLSPVESSLINRNPVRSESGTKSPISRG